MQNPIQSRGIRSLGLIVIGALSLAVVGGMALTHAAVSDAMMWGWHDGMWNGGHMAGWSGWGWGMMVVGLLWMALPVALPLYLVCGEIDDEEFDRRRARLTPDDDR